MNLYHISVMQDQGWYVGRVLEREGVTTQGRTLDELVFMVRDAISLMWDEDSVQLELIIPSQTSFGPAAKRSTAKTKLVGINKREKIAAKTLRR